MIRLLAVALALLLSCRTVPPAHAEDPPLQIAVHTSLGGSGAFAGKAYLEAIRFAVTEANASGNGPRFDVIVSDDASTESNARAAARRVIDSQALLVLGPVLSPLAIAVCPIYGQAGLPVIISTVHADELTDNPTTFRTVISTGEIGEALADYLGRVLHGASAIVLSKDNGYGRPLASHFQRSADRQGVATTYRSFTTVEQRDATARELGSTPNDVPIVLGMTYEDAVPVLTILRREGYRGMVMGTATMARASFAELFASQPESHGAPGFFVDGAYATSPMILDSANAEILAFASRFQAKFGQEPSWESVQAYDGALLAMAALRDAARQPGFAAADIRARRDAVLGSLQAFNAPTRAVAGLNGPIWFDAGRISHEAVRIGRFHGAQFESAPLQLWPVLDPDPGEIASGAVFETEKGRFYRLQRVVQTGTFMNLIPHVDIAKSSFGADFYLWLRYAHDAGPGAADPADITFPNMLSGRFNPARPAESTLMADGTEYRLWRIQGEFRNDFDLHRFPFDRQDLQLRFLNARASSDRIVYVLDRRSASATDSIAPPSASAGLISSSAHAAAPAAVHGTSTLASPDAFNELSQWAPAQAQERRDTLVTSSALGDLRRVGLQTPRELSGFLITYGIQRQTAAALIKTLFPMLLMCVVMYATLHFPHALTKEKVTVAVTAVLSCAVLLSSVNSQLGGVGYTIAVEYGFYAFFALGLICVVYVMGFETLRLSGRDVAARWLEQATRVTFLLGVMAVFAAAAVFWAADRI